MNLQKYLPTCYEQILRKNTKPTWILVKININRCKGIPEKNVKSYI